MNAFDDKARPAKQVMKASNVNTYEKEKKMKTQRINFVMTYALMLGLASVGYAQTEFDVNGDFRVNGFVGIGTTTPIADLDIVSPKRAAAALRLEGDMSSLGGWANYIMLDAPSSPADPNHRHFMIVNRNASIVGGANRLDIHGVNDDGSSAQSILTMKHSGAIGIGTQEPKQELHICRFDDGAAALRLEGHRLEPGGWVNSIDLYAPSSPAATDKKNFRIINANAQDAGGENRLYVRSSKDDGSTSKYILTMTHGGNVGIGKSSPAHKLDVAGDIRCVAIHETSDERFKTNITELSHVLDKVEKLRGVSFEWNDKAESVGARAGQKQIGVVAQEVETVFPELVASTTEGYKSVDYTKLTAVLIEAVKELKTENESLKIRLETLETTLE